MRTRLAILLTFLIFLSPKLFAEETRIYDIIQNSGEYSNDFVTVEGVIIKYNPGANNSTAFYTIKGDFGGEIQVNTNGERPEVNKRYTVEGTVVIDGTTYKEDANGNPVDNVYMIEKNKVIKTSMKDWLLIGGIACLVVLVVIIVLMLKKQRTTSVLNSSDSTSQSSQKSDSTPLVTANDFKTIRVNLNEAPKTMKLMPGLLEISAGPDKGKKFYISGYQTPYGNVVTIGREEVQGDKKYAHIQLFDNTISRKQAEIISVGDKTFVKNLSQVNYTLLDGEKIEANDMKEISLGSVIKTGAVEFTYRLN